MSAAHHNVVPFGADPTKYYSEIPRIDPEHKKRWLEALRSGEYAQGTQRLRTNEGKFCCLGVYCEIVDVPKQFLNKDAYGRDLGLISRWEYGDGYYRSSTSIPPTYAIPYDGPVKRPYSLTDFDGVAVIFACTDPNGDWREWMLPTLNDSGEFNFNQIADIIDYFL